MLKKLGRKLKKGLKKAAPIKALAGAAALAGRKGRAAKAMQKSTTADVGRSQIPMADRMVQGLNFPAGTDLSGMSDLAAAGSIDRLKKGGRVGCGKAKKGFGRALRKK